MAIVPITPTRATTMSVSRIVKPDSREGVLIHGSPAQVRCHGRASGVWDQSPIPQDVTGAIADQPFFVRAPFRDSESRFGALVAGDSRADAYGALRYEISDQSVPNASRTFPGRRPNAP